MLKIIQSLSLELTRRCNSSCSHCMRGEPENIDLSKEYIDKILSEKHLIIANLTFSGGEPTLTPDLIIYIINKIISERKIVLSLQMTTNGIIYDERIIRAFENYAIHSKKYFSEFHKLFGIEEIASIRLSNDQYHSIPSHPNYQSINNKLPDISITNTGLIDILDDELILTGRAKEKTFGRYFNYQLKDLNIKKDDSIFTFFNSFYLTATGFITTQGDGEYQDMDHINMGRVEDFSFSSLIPKSPNLKKVPS